MVGYSTEFGSTTVQFSPNQQITRFDIPSGNVLTLYAIWKSKYIVVFDEGAAPSVSGSQEPMVVDGGDNVKIGKCGYVHGGETVQQFKYYNDELWENTSGYFIGDAKPMYEFSHWQYFSPNGKVVHIPDEGYICI